MKLLYTVPEKFRQVYLEEQNKFNVKNIIVIGLIIHLTQLFVYISTKITPFSDDAVIMKGYFRFYELIILFSIPYLILMMVFVRKKGSQHRFVPRFILGYAFMLLFWAMGVALADQFQGQEVVVYYVAIFCLAIAVDLSVKDYTILLLIIQSIFIAILPMYNSYVGETNEVIYSSFQYIFFGVVIRYYIGELKKKNFVQNANLESLNEELYFLSYYDPLSKLYNRRKWEENYYNMYQKAMIEEKPIDVIITDIDYFKGYNDTFGHVAGDQIIRDVSNILIDATEGYERNVGRYGGDEFAMSFYKLQPDDCRQIVHKINEQLSRQINIGSKIDNSALISMSFGCHRIIPKATDQPWDLIVLADQKLYKRKSERHKTG